MHRGALRYRDPRPGSNAPLAAIEDVFEQLDPGQVLQVDRRPMRF